MPVHIPDESRPCLPVGATELFLRGHVPTIDQIPVNEDVKKFWVGKWLLLRTDPTDPALPARRHMVRVVEVEAVIDPLAQPGEVTRITWEDEQALPFEICLRDMVVRGNMVFATAGETFKEFPPSKATGISSRKKLNLYSALSSARGHSMM